MAVRFRAECPDLANWLAEHPRITDAIVWEDESGSHAYADWSPEQREQLARRANSQFDGTWAGPPAPPPLAWPDDTLTTRLSPETPNSLSSVLLYITLLPPNSRNSCRPQRRNHS
jgi:hypothetical protein